MTHAIRRMRLSARVRRSSWIQIATITALMLTATLASAQFRASIQGTVTAIHDLLGGTEITPAPVVVGRHYGGPGGSGPVVPPRISFKFNVLPHSFRAFTPK